MDEAQLTGLAHMSRLIQSMDLGGPLTAQEIEQIIAQEEESGMEPVLPIAPSARRQQQSGRREDALTQMRQIIQQAQPGVSVSKMGSRQVLQQLMAGGAPAPTAAPAAAPLPTPPSLPPLA